MYYFSAELKAKQETIQSKKVEDALKRPRAVLDAETQKILHSFLQGEYCLSFGFSLTHVGIVLKDPFRIRRFRHGARQPTQLDHMVGSRARKQNISFQGRRSELYQRVPGRQVWNPSLEEELVGGNMNSVMASMSCNIMSGPQVSYQLQFLRHAS